ncbi:MarR family transcriptional regulator [Rhodobacteraceae bacterium WD3A24]|nr:MarR family transcriptional regulator [Rhodobacteraceae bacterium WD3A24]
MAHKTDLSDAEAEALREGRFLDDYLLFLLASVSAAASEGFHAIVRDRGLKVPEWRVLASLYDSDGQMITRLAALVMMEQSRLTRIVERMDERGLVTRRDDKADRRRVRVYLTAKGKAVAHEMVAEARDHEARLLSLLPAGQARQLKSLLLKLHGRIGAVGPEWPSEKPGVKAQSPRRVV